MFGSFWNHIWDHFGTIWVCFGIILGSFWDHFRIHLGSFWDQFGIVLASFGDKFRIILGSFWDHCRINLGSFFIIVGPTDKKKIFQPEFLSVATAQFSQPAGGEAGELFNCF